MTIVSVLALLVMMAATVGMIWEFFQLNRNDKNIQANLDRKMVQGDELLIKLNQLVELLTAMNVAVATIIAAKLPSKRKTVKRKRKPVAVVPMSTVDAATKISDSATIELKGGNDDKKTNSLN